MGGRGAEAERRGDSEGAAPGWCGVPREPCAEAEAARGGTPGEPCVGAPGGVPCPGAVPGEPSAWALPGREDMPKEPCPERDGVPRSEAVPGEAWLLEAPLVGSVAGIGRRRNVISAAVSAGAPGRRGVEGRPAGRGGVPTGRGGVPTGRGGVPAGAAGPGLPEFREAPVAGCRPEFSALGDVPVDGRRPKFSALGDVPVAGCRPEFSAFGDVPVDGRRPKFSALGDAPVDGRRSVLSAFRDAPAPARPASGGVSGKRAEARGGGGAVPEPGDGIRALGWGRVSEEVGVREPVGSGSRPSPLGSGLTSTPPGTDPSVRASSPPSQSSSRGSPVTGGRGGLGGRGGTAGGGGVDGRGGMGARRASVLMHPPFPRPLARPRAWAAVVLLGLPHPVRTPPTRHAYPRRGTVIPAPDAAVDVPTCVRVTLRVEPARTGTSPRPRADLPGTSPYPAVIPSGRLRS
ncbi:hypothetical protein SAMN05216482_2034 [Streptomyces sp. PAN_FS17]|nr:hypothetical protein SAMN05216482_2034 [Streptomyces sp. PAN_FS17]